MECDRLDQKENFIPYPGKCIDLPAVNVGYGGLEAAIRLLQKKMGKSGVLRLLRTRKQHPAPADRDRYKRKSADARRVRDAAKRSAWKARA
jgi:ribosomal protein S21